jgi:hypothetical protein
MTQPIKRPYIPTDKGSKIKVGGRIESIDASTETI